MRSKCKKRLKLPDWPSFFSVIAVFAINLGVLKQWSHILTTGKHDGIDLIAWYAFALSLGYLSWFAQYKKQHWTLRVNYLVSTVLHSSVAITVTLMRGLI